MFVVACFIFVGYHVYLFYVSTLQSCYPLLFFLAARWWLDDTDTEVMNRYNQSGGGGAPNITWMSGKATRKLGKTPAHNARNFFPLFPGTSRI